MILPCKMCGLKSYYGMADSEVSKPWPDASTAGCHAPVKVNSCRDGTSTVRRAALQVQCSTVLIMYARGVPSVYTTTGPLSPSGTENCTLPELCKTAGPAVARTNTLAHEDSGRHSTWPYDTQEDSAFTQLLLVATASERRDLHLNCWQNYAESV